MGVPTFVLYALAAPTALWIFAYFAPLLYCLARGSQDLKRKYDAKWALVTGGSTGIGRALCEELAKQQLCVVIAALDDEHLPKAVAELEAAYPGLEFRAVACNFGPGQSYLDKIAKATADVDVQLVFNNAGFIVTGFFDTQPAGKLLVNVECNATAATSITHHFTALMLQKRLRGCVVFTSSASAYIPNPFAVSYGATKAYMSQFAASIAVELSCKGIDVLVVHPSPVASHFYNKVLSLPLSARAERAPSDARRLLPATRSSTRSTRWSSSRRSPCRRPTCRTRSSARSAAWSCATSAAPRSACGSASRCSRTTRSRASSRSRRPSSPTTRRTTRTAAAASKRPSDRRAPRAPRSRRDRARRARSRAPSR